jgi:hypothetical protein
MHTQRLNADLNLGVEERVRQARQWLDSCGLAYRGQRSTGDSSELTEAHMEELVFLLANGRGALQEHYQCIYVLDLERDRALTAGVCPLFVLHALAAHLATGAAVQHAWLLALHCLKVKLAATATLPAFLVRLFDLIHHDRVMQPQERKRLPQTLCNLIAAFLCDSLALLVPGPSADSAPLRYGCHTLGDCGALVELVNANVFGGARQSMRGAEHVAKLVYHAALGDWEQYQCQRYSFGSCPSLVPLVINKTVDANGVVTMTAQRRV